MTLAQAYRKTTRGQKTTVEAWLAAEVLVSGEPMVRSVLIDRMRTMGLSEKEIGSFLIRAEVVS